MISRKGSSWRISWNFLNENLRFSNYLCIFAKKKAMSSYLNIYGVNKKTKEKELIVDYSRSNEMYGLLYDGLMITSAYSFNGGEDEEERYTKITASDVERAIGGEQEFIGRMEKRLVEMEKYANGNTEIIDEIISLKETIRETQQTVNKADFLLDILYDTENGYNAFEEIVANIT